MKNNFEQDELIIKKLSGSLSPQEADVFQEMIASDEKFFEKYTSFKLVWNDTADLEVLSGKPEEERWQELNARMARENQISKKPVSLWIGRYAAVIAFLFLCSVAAFLLLREKREWEIVSTIEGEVKDVELPDLSSVTINANSSVKYDPADWEEERIIFLEGEAFFTVRKTGAPFVVYAKDAKVEVLGTSFNILAKQEGVQIACGEGKVRVQSEKEENQGRILQKGDGIELKNGELGEVFAVDITNVAVWRSGKLVFEEAPLHEVVNRLEQYFNIQIESDTPVDHLTFSGKFNNPQLDETLKTICLSAGLKYEFIDQHRVRIY